MDRPTLRDMVEDDRTNIQKSEECLMILSDGERELSINGKADLRAGATVFALLAVVDQLQTLTARLASK